MSDISIGEPGQKPAITILSSLSSPHFRAVSGQICHHARTLNIIFWALLWPEAVLFKTVARELARAIRGEWLRVCPPVMGDGVDGQIT